MSDEAYVIGWFTRNEIMAELKMIKTDRHLLR